MALTDAGALHDPVIAGLDARGEFGIGDDVLRQVAAGGENQRSTNRHDSKRRRHCFTAGDRHQLGDILAHPFHGVILHHVDGNTDGVGETE
jgi:hypothetical protein